MFATVRGKVFPFIHELGTGTEGAEDSSYAQHRKDVTFMMPSARVLQVPRSLTPRQAPRH